MRACEASRLLEVERHRKMESLYVQNLKDLGQFVGKNFKDARDENKFRTHSILEKLRTHYHRGLSPTPHLTTSSVGPVSFSPYEMCFASAFLHTAPFPQSSPFNGPSRVTPLSSPYPSGQQPKPLSIILPPTQCRKMPTRCSSPTTCSGTNTEVGPTSSRQ